MATEQKQIRLRRDTAARWQQNNPLLAAGELGVDMDNGYARLGTNGTQHFLDVDPFLTFDPLSGALPAAVLAYLDGRVSRETGSVTINTYMSPDGTYEYEVVTVKASAGGMPNVVEKVYTNDYEKTWTGGAFSPSSQPFMNFQTQTGAYVVLSADAYQGGRMSGLQIKNGVVYSGWGNYSNDPRIGQESIALMQDGSWATFTATDYPDPASVVSDGARTTWGFGPLVVIDGAVRSNLGDATVWTDWVTALSARNILGYNAAGDMINILVKGKSGTSGIAGVEMGNVALRHGCVNAIMLDGGGSVQAAARHKFHISSDTGANRDVWDATVIKVPPTTPVRVAEVPVPYASSTYTGTNGYVLTARKSEGETRLRGPVFMASIAANTWYTVATLPERFRPGSSDSFRGAVFTSINGQAGDISISPTDGTIQLKSPVAGTNSYWQLDNVKFDAAY